MYLLLLCMSFSACLAATGWSLRLIWRMRDPRLGGLTALLTLLCVWHVATAVAVWGTPPGIDTVFRMESPTALTFRGMIAGVSGLAAVAFVSRILAEQRHLATQLAQSEASARSLAENVPDVVCRFDRNLRHVFINRQIEARTGIPAHQFLGKSNRELGMSAELVVYWEAKLTSVFHNGLEETLEFEYPSPTGPRHFEARLVPEFGPDSHIATVLCITRDITERKHADDVQRSSNQTLYSLIESSPLAVVVVDQAGRVTTWNTSAERMFGWRSAEVIGRVLPTVPPDQRACFEAMIREEFAGEQHVGLEVTRIRKDGSPVNAQLWTAPIYDAGGRIVATLGMLADISERRRVEGALRDSELRLAHVARLSTMGEMVAGIAHEINQPLYAISNYANACTNTLTHEPDLAADKIPYWTQQIAEQAIRAGEIIRRLRGFAQKTPSRRTQLQLEQVVHESLTLVAADIRRHQVDVQLELAPLVAAVLADRVQIQQVLVNLIKNACEALSDASLQDRRLIVRAVSTDDAIEIAVEDNGPGLPDDANDRVFEAFYTTKVDGLGMGLAISRTIVEAHGGRLTAVNMPVRGAAVRFTLPLAAKNAA